MRTWILPPYLYIFGFCISRSHRQYCNPPPPLYYVKIFFKMVSCFIGNSYRSRNSHFRESLYCFMYLLQVFIFL